MLRRITLYLFSGIIPIIAIVALDVLIGKSLNIEEVRESSRMFRAEAAPLQLHTKKLLPNIDHSYQHITREDPRYTGDITNPRMFRTNNIGTIVGEKTDNIDENKILFLGGSTTECNEVDEEFRFPKLVGEKLTNSTGKKFRGVNLGVRGNTSHDSLNLLLNHPATRSSETIVLMHNINDRLMLSLRDSYHTFISPPALTSWANVLSSLYSTAIAIWEYASYQSNLVFMLNQSLGVNPWTGGRFAEGVVDEDSIEYNDPNIENSIRQYKTSLRSFIAVTRAHNKTPVLMTQPLGRASTSQNMFNQAIRDVSSTESVHLIDLEQYLGSSNNGLFFSDDIHLNNEGSRVLSDFIAQSLLSNVFETNQPSEISTSLYTNRSLVENLSICKSPTSSTTPQKANNRHLLLMESGRYPVLSADHKFILFQSMREGKEIVKIFDIDKNNSETISSLNETDSDRHAIFYRNSDGETKIIFARSKNGIEKIYQSNLLGSQITPIDLPDNLSASIPTSHGNTIFFSGNKISPNGRHLTPPDLYSFQNGTVQQLTETPWEEWRPAISPTGSVLFHISNQKGQFEISRIDLQQGEKSTVYDSDSDEWDPSISPNGKWITFASRETGNWGLMISNLEHPNLAVQLTGNNGIDDWDPIFSPDGNAILFASSRMNNPPYMYFICPFGEEPK